MSCRWERAAGVVALVLLGACAKEQPKPAAAPPGPAKGTPEWKIQNAMRAMPAGLASGATIMDWPSGPNAPMATLRKGSNGWTCLPDEPSTPTNDPVCGDSVSFAWYGQLMAKQPPHITTVAMAYMLQGASDPSNTDPFKEKPDSGQEWVVTGPHVMIFVPDPKVFRGLPTDWKSGAPYVMFANTPYAHLMVPVASASGSMAGMPGMN
jgi:hypothetical protein